MDPQKLTAPFAARRLAPQPGGYSTSFPYYSSVIFRGAPASPAVTGYAYAFPHGDERKAFGYAEGQEWETAGATTALDGRATFAETNLSKPGETIAGEALEIMGLAIQVQPAITDGLRYLEPRLLAHIATNVSVELSLHGGGQSFKLGTVGQIPGAGGLVGSGRDGLAFAIAGAVHAPDFGFAANGWQVRSNFYRLPEGLIWRPSGNPDSQLTVIFRTVRAFTLYHGGDVDNAQDDVALTPVHPDYVAAVLKVHLIGRQYSPRSSVR
jgi:hypothetical protein